METQNNYIKNTQDNTMEIYQITWQEIPVMITYTHYYFASVRVSHLAIKAAQPLPITKTGYRSIWLLEAELGEKSPIRYVFETLEAMSQLKK